MRVGSIVECTRDTHTGHAMWLRSKGTVFPKVGKTYTIRAFYNDNHGETGVLLEEIVNGIIEFADMTIEPAFFIKRFRELLPPSELPEELTEILTNSKEIA